MDREQEYYNGEVSWPDQEKERSETQKLRRVRRRSFFGGFVTGLFAVAMIACGFWVGSLLDEWLTSRPGQVQGDSQRGEGDGDEPLVTMELLQKIQEMEQVIRQRYYKDEDIDAQAMEEGIYRGMVESLGDIYSQYFTREEIEELLKQTQGIYYGIGVSVSLDTDTSYPKIIKVYEGTPGEEAGLRDGDIIYEIEGESAYELSLNDVVAKIKGDEGTWVNLTIVREGASDYLSIDVQRRKVNTPTVEFEMLDDGMAYILITEFDDITVDQFTEALAMARGNHMKGLILDLRGNPGGNLDSVVKISQRILPKGLIVYTEDKYGNRKEYTCDGKKQLEVPLVVLIDGNSASASELLAGAIKDYGIGTLVGTTTYGKGIVQSVAPLSDGSAVKLTISSYFTPKGNNIHGIGVEPDIECKFDGEAYYNDPAKPDNQLEKAKEVLKEMIK